MTLLIATIFLLLFYHLLFLNFRFDDDGKSNEKQTQRSQRSIWNWLIYFD